jgi:hypothetical protein
MLTTATIVLCIQPCQSSTRSSILFINSSLHYALFYVRSSGLLFFKRGLQLKGDACGGCVHKWWMLERGIHFLTFSWCISVMCIHSRIACTKKLPENPVQTIRATTWLLTYSTQRRPSWEANQFSATQEILLINWTRSFITAFTSARHLSLFWARSIQSMAPIQIPEHPS